MYQVKWGPQWTVEVKRWERRLRFWPRRTRVLQARLNLEGPDRNTILVQPLVEGVSLPNGNPLPQGVWTPVLLDESTNVLVRFLGGLSLSRNGWVFGGF